MAKWPFRHRLAALASILAGWMKVRGLRWGKSREVGSRSDGEDGVWRGRSEPVFILKEACWDNQFIWGEGGIIWLNSAWKGMKGRIGIVPKGKARVVIEIDKASGFSTGLQWCQDPWQDTQHAGARGERLSHCLLSINLSLSLSSCLPHTHTFNQPNVASIPPPHLPGALKPAVKPWWTASNENEMIKQLCLNNVWLGE